MSETDTPTPGSPEYDAAMSARYRRQFAAPGQRGSARPESLEYRPSEVAETLQVRKGSTLGPAHQPMKYTAQQADRGQLVTLQEDIRRLQAQLDETSTSRQGGPSHRYTGDAREAIRRQLELLETVQLPYVRQQVEAAEAWRAANVKSPEAKLAEEAERRQAIRVRAQEIADEREAQAQADKVAAARNSSREW